ncbi:MAG TPA: hypothetical protein VLL82_10530, partial [Mycobacterium sp.]|nr:hypothetical protein [Mycobacterium sp.]
MFDQVKVWEGLPVSEVAFERYRLPTLIGHGGMGKVIAAAGIALAPFSVVATTPGVAQAAPCIGVGADHMSCRNCLTSVALDPNLTNQVCFGIGAAGPAAPPHPGNAPPSRVPVQTPQVVPPSPPPAPPSVTPMQIPEAPPMPALPEPAPPSVTVQTPQVVPPSPPPPGMIPVQPPKINP